MLDVLNYPQGVPDGSNWSPPHGVDNINRMCYEYFMNPKTGFNLGHTHISLVVVPSGV